MLASTTLGCRGANVGAGVAVGKGVAVGVPDGAVEVKALALSNDSSVSAAEAPGVLIGSNLRSIDEGKSTVLSALGPDKSDDEDVTISCDSKVGIVTCWEFAATSGTGSVSSSFSTSSINLSVNPLRKGLF